MSLDDWHLVFILICLMIVFAAIAPIITPYLPKREEQFIALAVLGEEGKAGQYYPEGSQNIEIGEEIHWSIYLYNHRGKAEYVALKVKLLNSTMLTPNSQSCSPSPYSIVYEIRRILLNNETMYYPFTWSIQSAKRDGNITSVDTLLINGKHIQVDVKADKIFYFQLVIELWVYDDESEDLVFGWSQGNDFCCAWNQIWFNVTTET